MDYIGVSLKTLIFLSAVSSIYAVNCSDLGNFDKKPPFEKFVDPKCPGEHDVRFLLFTNSNPDQYQNISADDIPAVYNGSNPTVYVLHGYQSDVKTALWMHHMKDAFLSQGEYNIILVDWSNLGTPGSGFNINNYYKAASNTRTVNAVILKHARSLQESGTSYLWCVGHSLGAHTCGHGKNPDLWNRVTGLDPAGPLFRDSDPAAGLRNTSASFVDVLHTYAQGFTIFDAFLYGLLRPAGHVDFYPNAARRQPGCPIGPTKKRRKRGVLGSICSHGRAYEYFTESINSTDCHFKTTSKCVNFKNIPKSCSDGNMQASMGFYATKHLSGLYYLETNGKSPYCKPLATPVAGMGSRPWQRASAYVTLLAVAMTYMV